MIKETIYSHKSDQFYYIYNGIYQILHTFISVELTIIQHVQKESKV